MANKWFKIKSIPMLMVSIAAGIIIWLVIMSSINPEISIKFSNIPVTIQGSTELYERMGYTILSSTDFSFDVELSGNRNSILRLSSSDVEIICDVSTISGDGENRIQCSVRTPFNDITVQNESSLLVTVEADKIIKKEITVLYEMVGNLDDNHVLGTPTLSTETVLVSGPTTELSKISYAFVSADISNLKDSTTLTLPISIVGESGDVTELKYTQLTTKSVDITIPVLLVKEVPFSIRVNNGGGLTSDSVEVTINPTKVTLVGESATLSEIESISLGSIDLDGIGDGVTTEKDFVLPSGIRCRTDRSSATVAVTVKDVEIRSYAVNTITVLGTIDGFETSVLSNSITIRLRGNAALLDTVTSDDFAVSVSLDNVVPQTGNYTIAADVKFIPAINAEVVPADYFVTVSLRKTENVIPEA